MFKMMAIGFGAMAMMVGCASNPPANDPSNASTTSAVTSGKVDSSNPGKPGSVAGEAGGASSEENTVTAWPGAQNNTPAASTGSGATSGPLGDPTGAPVKK